MAAIIAEENGNKPEHLRGCLSEFAIWVGDRQVAGKSLKGFPSDETVIRAVRAALAQ